MLFSKWFQRIEHREKERGEKKEKRDIKKT